MKVVLLLAIVVLFFLLHNRKTSCKDHSCYSSHRPKVSISHIADALLLTCIDYRFITPIAKYMKNITYDRFSLAGGSLGVNQTKYPEWGESFWETVDLSLKLHDIKKVIINDHMDCGAYKMFYGTTNGSGEE